jgi:hypothetical protein
MKNKNPLYVVKGDQVEAATDLFDMLVKKLNLTPVIEIFTSLVKILLENISTYAMFIAVKEFFDFLIQKIELFRKFSLI